MQVIVSSSFVALLLSPRAHKLPKSVPLQVWSVSPQVLFLLFLMLEMRSCVREETSKRRIYPVSSDVDLYFKGTADAADGGIEIGDNI